MARESFRDHGLFVAFIMLGENAADTFRDTSAPLVDPTLRHGCDQAPIIQNLEERREGLPIGNAAFRFNVPRQQFLALGDRALKRPRVLINHDATFTTADSVTCPPWDGFPSAASSPLRRVRSTCRCGDG
jgi:hypothetical protein